MFDGEEPGKSFGGGSSESDGCAGTGSGVSFGLSRSGCGEGILKSDASKSRALLAGGFAGTRGTTGPNSTAPSILGEVSERLSIGGAGSTISLGELSSLKGRS